MNRIVINVKLRIPADQYDMFNCIHILYVIEFGGLYFSWKIVSVSCVYGVWRTVCNVLVEFLHE
jgi:multidrug transporter EmrE-like cation transporter